MLLGSPALPAELACCEILQSVCVCNGRLLFRWEQRDGISRVVSCQDPTPCMSSLTDQYICSLIPPTPVIPWPYQSSMRQHNRSPHLPNALVFACFPRDYALLIISDSSFPSACLIPLPSPSCVPRAISHRPALYFLAFRAPFSDSISLRKSLLPFGVL